MYNHISRKYYIIMISIACIIVLSCIIIFFTNWRIKYINTSVSLNTLYTTNDADGNRIMLKSIKMPNWCMWRTFYSVRQYKKYVVLCEIVPENYFLVESSLDNINRYTNNLDNITKYTMTNNINNKIYYLHTVANYSNGYVPIIPNNIIRFIKPRDIIFSLMSTTTTDFVGYKKEITGIIYCLMILIGLYVVI